jgi:hypothetical protein
MKLTDSKSFTMLSPATDHTDSRAAPGIFERQCRDVFFHVSANTANRRRGKSSNNQLPAGLARYALNIIRERYIDFGPTQAPKMW